MKRYSGERQEQSAFIFSQLHLSERFGIASFLTSDTTAQLFLVLLVRFPGLEKKRAV